MLVVRKMNTVKFSERWFCTRVLCPYSASKVEVNTEWNQAKEYKEIPGLSHIQSLLGFLPGGRFHKKSFVQLQKDLFRDYGNIYKISGTLGTKDIICLTDPSDFEKVFRTEGPYPMRNVMESVDYYRKVHRKDKFENGVGLITQSGPDWWFFRQKANPLFMNTKFAQLYLPHVDNVARDFLKLIDEKRGVNDVIQGNLVNYLKMWSLETVVYIITGLRKNYLGKNQMDVEKISHYVEQFFSEVYKLNQQPSPWKYIRTPTFLKHMQTQDDGYKFVHDIIEEAKLNLKNNPNTKNQTCLLEKLLENDPKISTVILFDSILPGIETTAFAMTGFIYVIAKNQKEQKLLRDEIRRNFPEGITKPIKPENIAQMTYSKAAIKESLRLLPFFSGIFRQTGDDLIIKGYQIPKDTVVFMNTTLASLQETNLVDPESFKPERWLRSNKDAQKINPFLSLPFGYGRRMCIGKRIVNIEMEMLIIHLIGTYHIELEKQYLEKEYLPYDFPMENLKFRFTKINF